MCLGSRYTPVFFLDILHEGVVYSGQGPMGSLGLRMQGGSRFDRDGSHKALPQQPNLVCHPPVDCIYCRGPLSADCARTTSLR